MNFNKKELLEVAINAANKAGVLIKSRFGGEMDIKFKEGVYNLVTEMDIVSENLIKEIINTKYPNSKFLAEESGGVSDLKDLTWVIDPIDGTVNYAHGIPIYSISIAAVNDNKSIVGVVYNPETNEMFTAIQGEGAYLNGNRLSVSNSDNINNSVLVTGFPYNISDNPYNCIGALIHMLKLGVPIRRLGSAALDLAYTAAGRFEAYWEVTLNEWDVAAGILLVIEAGGVVESYSNESNDNFIITDKLIASNGKVNNQIKEILRLY